MVDCTAVSGQYLDFSLGMEGGVTPLVLAAQEGNTEIVQMLLVRRNTSSRTVASAAAKHT